MIKRLLLKFGIDKAVAWVLINRLWAIFKGPITIIFIISFLTSQEQGVWFTFVSLGALSVFAELGFTMIITQFVSHEYAHVRMKNHFIIGEKRNVDKLFSLVRYAIKFYLIVVPLAIIILLGVGMYVFDNENSTVMFAWIVFSVTSGFRLLASLLQAIYEGLDKVVDIQKNIFLGSVTITLFTWIMLSLGFGVWSLAIGNFIGICVMGYFLYEKAIHFWFQLMHHRVTHEFRWFNEIVKLQWRYAISWASGYFIFQLYVPYIYKLEGSVPAGQFGLTASMIMAIFVMSSATLDAKIPKFNVMVAKGEQEELNHSFKKAFVQRYLLFLIASAMAIGLLYLMNCYQFYQDRFLAFPLILLFFTLQIPMVTITSMAVYLRSHKAEPYYWLSVFNAILIVLAIVVILPKYSLFGLLVSINIINWAIILPLAAIIFFKFKRSYYIIESNKNG